MINWIKVEDRLPEPYQSVLVARNDCWSIGEIIYNGEFDSVGEELLLFTPTHWANLSDINLPIE